MRTTAAAHHDDDARAHDDVRVSTLELFFDLVFVFTVTQFTSVLAGEPDVTGVAKVVVALGIVFWMYGAYAWLTNAIEVHRPTHRLLLLGGMGGFLVIALAIPAAFSGSGATFALAYLFVVVLHVVLYTHASSESSVRAILAIAPLNVVSALLVLAGGIAGGTAQWVLWPAAVALEWLTPTLRGVEGFEIAPGHFVERHGLLIIVALGESVVAVGAGAEGLAVDASLVAVALLGLALSAALWWTYFGDEDEVDHAMRALPPPRRARAAIQGFGYAHWAMLLGIVAAAMGVKKTVGHAGEPLDWAVAALLAGGTAAFVLADVAFRRILGIARSDAARAAGAAGVLATIPAGALVSGATQLAALAVVLGAALAAEAAAGRPVPRVTPPAGPQAAPAPPARGG